MFQKRHYEKLARFVRQSTIAGPTRSRLIEELCRFLADDNPRFNAVYFRTACTMGEIA